MDKNNKKINILKRQTKKYQTQQVYYHIFFFLSLDNCSCWVQRNLFGLTKNKVRDDHSANHIIIIIINPSSHTKQTLQMSIYIAREKNKQTKQKKAKKNSLEFIDSDNKQNCFYWNFVMLLYFNNLIKRQSNTDQI